jgi:hypothetical protein
MKNSKKIALVLAIVLCCLTNVKAQVNAETKEKKSKVGIGLETPAVKSNQKGINNINNGMPNRISMNVTIAKQTQGATFGEKVNAGKINITLIENGCVVLFSSNEGYKINIIDKSINAMSEKESLVFGKKVNQGLHAAGGALAQGASLLGGLCLEDPLFRLQFRVSAI